MEEEISNSPEPTGYVSPFDQAQKDAEDAVPPIGLNNNPSALLKILEINPDLVNYATRLRGVELVYDKKNKEWIQKAAGQPLVNEAGLNFIFGELESVAMVSTKTSILTVERIYAIERTKIEVITNGLFINQKKFGISDEDYEVIAPAITADCLAMMEIILRHAEGGHTQDNLIRSIKESRMDVTSSEPKKGGFWHSINPANWGK